MDKKFPSKYESSKCDTNLLHLLENMCNFHGLFLEGVYKIELDTKTEYGGF
jgi:hypothetical protein